MGRANGGTEICVLIRVKAFYVLRLMCRTGSINKGLLRVNENEVFIHLLHKKRRKNIIIMCIPHNVS